MTEHTVNEAVSVNYSTASGNMAAMYRPSEQTKPGRARCTAYGENRASAAIKAAIAAIENYRRTEGHTSPVWATPDNAVVGRVGRNTYVVTFTGTRA